MADKTLRQMNREQLLELIYELKQSEDRLIQEKTELEDKLKDRTICIESAGSIADAALQLNDIFAVAQAAADDYLNSVLASHSDEAAEAEAIRSAAEADAARKTAEADNYMRKMREEADSYLEEKKAEARQILEAAEAEANMITERAEKAARFCIRQARAERDKIVGEQ